MLKIEVTGAKTNWKTAKLLYKYQRAKYIYVWYKSDFGIYSEVPDL